MRKRFVIGLAATSLAAMWALAGSAGSPPAPSPALHTVDARFDALVPPNTPIEKIADGFSWVEGPVWHRRERFLLFSDIPQNTVIKWQAGKGASVFLKQAGYSSPEPFAGREPGSNGLAFDAAGRLVLAQHGDRRIGRLEKDGAITALADRYEGKRLNSPNDLVFRSNGDLYFTDPFFGLPKWAEDPAKELAFQGVYRLSSAGKLTLLTRELPFPNGIAFSPDEKTLYVSNADVKRPEWWAFPVKDDGTLGPGRLLYDGTALLRNGKGGADGIKVDRAGNLFTAGPGGIYVFAPDGTLLGNILLGVATGNCAWGGDGSDLYIAADSAIYRVRTATKGHGF